MIKKIIKAVINISTIKNKHRYSILMYSNIMESIENNQNMSVVLKKIQRMNLDQIEDIIPNLIANSIDQSSLIEDNNNLLDQSIIRENFLEGNPNKIFDIMEGKINSYLGYIDYKIDIKISESDNMETFNSLLLNPVDTKQIQALADQITSCTFPQDFYLLDMKTFVSDQNSEIDKKINQLNNQGLLRLKECIQKTFRVLQIIKEVYNEKFDDQPTFKI